MSVNIGNNVINVAGRMLPIPYVERAVVRDDVIDIKLALYVPYSEGQVLGDVTGSLKKLKYYVGQVFDGDASGSLDTDSDGSLDYDYTEANIFGGRTRRFDAIVSDKGALDYLIDVTKPHHYTDLFIHSDSLSSSLGATGYSSGDLVIYRIDGHKQLSALNFEDFTLVDDAEDEDESNMPTMIAHYTADITLSAVGSAAYFANGVYSGSVNVDYDLSLIAFSSLLDFSTVGDGSGETPEALEKAIEDPRYATLYSALCSQVSHEKVFRNGYIVLDPTAVYYLNTGKVYNGNPIQTIDGSFHVSTPKINRGTMVEQFETLYTNPSTDTQTPGLAEMVSGFKYIINTYGQTEELLPRLNLFKKSFIDKSPGTTTGQWYNLFERSLMTVNRMAFENPSVRRELVTTPVVVDSRTKISDTYSPPADLSGEYDLDTDYVYGSSNSVIMTRNAYFEGEPPEDKYDNDFVLVEGGFFFFDYEKALKTQSAISKLMDVNRIEAYFGKSATNQYFNLKEAGYLRRGETDGLILPIYASRAYFRANDGGVGPPTTSYPYLEYFTTWGWTESDEDGGAGYIKYRTSFDPSGSSKTLYPEIMLRNLVVPGADSLNDYRMMSFQFQSIFDSEGSYYDSPRNNDTIEFQTVVYDHTRALVMAITSSLAAFLTETDTTAYSRHTGSLKDYVQYAEQFCSYNDLDGVFNQFFVDEMNATYVANPSSAPWFRAPAMFNIYRDLMYDTFGGDTSKITDETIIISQKISPSTGNLEDLQSFYVDFQNLVEAVTDGIDLSSVSDEIRLEFGFTNEIDVMDYGYPDFAAMADSETYTAWDWEYTKDMYVDFSAAGEEAWEAADYQTLYDNAGSIMTEFALPMDAVYSELLSEINTFADTQDSWVFLYGYEIGDAVTMYYTVTIDGTVASSTDISTIQAYAEDGSMVDNTYYKVQLYAYPNAVDGKGVYQRLKITQYVGTSRDEAAGFQAPIYIKES